ncbi:hypothetical protein Godav_011057 [Gossypium davidsonii]|uniref:Pectinesterase inhibitor domain-containing protein n=2 Tax=Gossypium TaxID=3633 RepID=A0A7J8RA11_GOSDV|nr:hypothetical protein [Gossypium davidsonii]
MRLVINNVELFVGIFCLYLSFSPPINAADGNNPLVAQACEKVKAKDLCISSLMAEHASKSADLAMLALISIKVASNNGTNTSFYIKKTLDTKKLEPAVEQNFQDCEDNYISATQQLDGAVSSLVSKNYKDTKMFLESAIDDAITCDNGLRKMPGNQLELPHRNIMFRQLCINALDVVLFLTTS